MTLGARRSAAILALGLLGLFGLSGMVRAELVTHQDRVQAITESTEPVESILDSPGLLADELTGPHNAALTANPPQGQPKPTDQTRAPATPTKAALTAAPATRTNTQPDPSLGEEIRSSVKETVRPLHHQLVESGAVDAWKELKTDLGLGKSEWRDEDVNAGNPKMSAPLDGPNAPRWQAPAQQPKTAAQVEMDRELATHMMEKLIDEVKPWVLSLLALYVVGYLVKAGLEHSQRKSIRRRERETRRTLRRASRHATSSKPET